eukprot:CAMPEP_0113913294 /NCGR_PEP_ID=MMETSP0780_2-20120614/29478_1 /TAXON_ID=652834 /ORGANISM="Palpitomonas bilix" /LENGTH=197 /DNA_ID=CAMNT_0000910499 /DNA_START=286 /DNA_END=875 /DNA_ORIENTATION=+ /assembly_acc=CAM_ASM_000599
MTTDKKLKSSQVKLYDASTDAGSDAAAVGAKKGEIPDKLLRHFNYCRQIIEEIRAFIGSVETGERTTAKDDEKLTRNVKALTHAVQYLDVLITYDTDTATVPQKFLSRVKNIVKESVRLLSTLQHHVVDLDEDEDIRESAMVVHTARSARKRAMEVMAEEELEKEAQEDLIREAMEQRRRENAGEEGDEKEQERGGG